MSKKIAPIDPELLNAEIHRDLFANDKNEFSRPNYVASAQFKEVSDVKTNPLPKFHLHQNGIDSALAADLVRDHLNLDGKTSLNLASFVHTHIDPEGLELCKENLTKNLADSDEYPAMVELMGRCVTIISNLWHADEGSQGVGTATTGSSEAIMLGGLAMKRRWEADRKAKGLPITKPNIIMGANAQVALEKFARYFDVEMRLLPIQQSAHFSFTMEDLYNACDENTIGVYAILGSTLTGHYQNVGEIHETLDKVEKDKGVNVSIHVDGASGGFVAPFCSPDLVWDFRLPRVRSINASGHKFGLTPAGCGWIIWRSQEYLPESLLFTLNYLGGSETTYTLNFSRPAHPIVYQYYALVKNGYEGFQSIHSVSLNLGRVLSVFLEGTGYFDVLSDIHRPRNTFFSESGKKTYPGGVKVIKDQPLSYFNDGLPVISFKFTDEFKESYPYIPQEAISSMLRDKGYIIPNYSLPPAHTELEVLRVVINDNMNLDLLNMLMQDIIRVTNRLISIGESIKTTNDVSAVRSAIAIISAADHAEIEHQDKWYKKAQGTSSYSRC